MKKYCFICISNEPIEICAINSERFELLREISNSKIDAPYSDKLIVINTEKLKLFIQTKLLKRENYEVESGDRFEPETLEQTIVFDSNKIKLNTSGPDNLVLFAINLYNSNSRTFKLLFSEYKRLPVNN